MRYRLLGGTHRDTKTGKVYKKGDVFRSESEDLMEIFKNKFEVVSSGVPKKKKRQKQGV